MENKPERWPAKRMTPFAFHVAPAEKAPITVTTWGGPLSSPTRFILPSEKNPSERLSGDQNGR